MLNLIEALKETRTRTLELVEDLKEAQLIGPRLQIVNPLRWEIGHVAWFQEFWVLRHLGGQPPILKNGDELYDSARVAHDTRWDLPLLERDETLAYMGQVLERIIEQASYGSRGLTDAAGYDEEYFLNLVLLHEQMHDEAITYTRQTLSYPPPGIGLAGKQSNDVAVVNKVRFAERNAPFAQTDDWLTGDAEIPGGKFTLGSAFEQGFVFDNEQLAHEFEVLPFAISKTAVTCGEFKHFVEDGGYRRSELHEAYAYCRWAGRRLPTEAEWEMAASAEPAANGQGLTERKRRYPWGDDAPTLERANLDGGALGCVPVDAQPAGDSAFGCRQMIGNVWEWTASDFQPYPGFVAGPYKEYSAPWFGDHKVLRGGCWVTRSSLIHNSYRNFYPPDRRDVWAGFRTCVLQTSAE